MLACSTLTDRSDAHARRAAAGNGGGDRVSGDGIEGTDRDGVGGNLRARASRGGGVLLGDDHIHVPETLAVPDTETPAASEVMNSLESAFIVNAPFAVIAAFSPTVARVAPS